MKSSLAEEDEVDFVILSSFKHDLKSPTLKWAEQWFHNYSARCAAFFSQIMRMSLRF